jgi:hypothetical protein
MNVYKLVLEYVNNCKEDEPIFIENIKEYVGTFINDEEKEKVFKNVNVVVNRLAKENIVVGADKGVYYKPTIGTWGIKVLPKRKIVTARYMVEPDGTVKGYVTGAKLFNWVGLTTQVPRRTDIATNECTHNKKYIVDGYNVIIRKPKIKITNDNYKYLQLLDILANNDKINVEVDDEEEKIYNFIKEEGIKKKKILKYARETNNRKVIEKIFVLAR